MDPEDQSLRQLVKQFRNQQPVIGKDATLRPPAIFQQNKTANVRQASQETDPELKELRQREGRLLNLGVLERAQMPPVSIDQEMDKMDLRKFITLTNQSLAQGYGSVPGYEDWQNSTRPPQDLRPPQDCQYPQDCRHPQDSTAFGRPQRDARGQQGQGTRGQGRQTCFGCGGSHRFTEYECQGLKDLIQQGFVHLSDRGRLVAGTRDRPGPVLPWLSNKGRLKGIKNWLRTYLEVDLDRPKEEQTQQRAPTVRTDFTAFHDGVVLQDSDEIWADWEDSYQVRPTDSVTPSQQRPQTWSTLRDSRTARTTVEPQAPPQEKNIQPEGYIQVISRPADKTAEARKENKLSGP
jgi:hypothetical protein